MHVPFGLEAYTSSRFLPMMERSPLFDAFYQEFAPGIFTNTTFCDQRVTTQHMFHRIDNFSQFNGASFGDGKYAYSGRVSVLPIYENDGRCLLHLGLAYQWRKGSHPRRLQRRHDAALEPEPGRHRRTPTSSASAPGRASATPSACKATTRGSSIPATSSPTTCSR